MKQISLPISKSSSARYIVSSYIADLAFSKELSDCDDTKTLIKNIDKKSGIIDIGPSGTCMRFLMALYASDPRCQNIILTGSKRMLSRPIKQLVNILIKMGADISQVENGWKINGKKLHGTSINCSNIESSQFISAILFIVPRISGRIILKNIKKCASYSYLKYTIDFLNKCKNYYKHYNLFGYHIFVPTNKTISIYQNIDTDWSALSFVYEWFICSNQPSLKILNYQKNSFTDEIAKVGTKFGIETSVMKESAILTKLNFPSTKIDHDFSNIPDEVLAFVLAAVKLGVPFSISGCSTLSGKECDRLAVLCQELKKCNIDVFYGQDMIFSLPKIRHNLFSFDKTHKISTHNDHRIAMAFAATGIDKEYIENPDVVNKSWPDFWKQIAELNEI